MNDKRKNMRPLTPAERAAVSGGASTDEFLASSFSGAAAGASIGATAGAAVFPAAGAVIGAAVGGFVGGFFGGVQYAASELFDYCF